MRELHLFAGIGGGILGGLLLGHQPVGAVEIDDFCRRVLRARQEDGSLPVFPLFGDIHTFDTTPFRGVDVVCGGFPCQPWSSAGKRLGADDPRHLWPEMARVVAECRPRYVFAENVAVKAFAEPWRDLRAMGYRLAPLLCLSASDVGAPHRRRRYWLLAADAERQGQHAVAVDAEVASAPAAVRAANGSGLAQREGERGDTRAELAPALRAGWWLAEPDVGGTLDGFSAWLVGSRWLAKANELLSAHGNAAKEDLAEALQGVRGVYGTETLSEWSHGAGAAIPRSAVLLAFLRQLTAHCGAADTSMAGTQASETGVRILRIEEVAARASLRRRSTKQRSEQPANALHALPQLLARIADQAWAAYRRSDACTAQHFESGVDRIARGVPARMDRLRALGNAQVPAVAAEAFRILMEAL